MPRRPPHLPAVVACVAALVLTGCSSDPVAPTPVSATEPAPGPTLPSGTAAQPDPSAAPRRLAAVDPATSLTASGVALLAGTSPQEDPRPRQDVTATLDPGTGALEGTWAAELPVGPGAGVARLRFFPGLPDLRASPRIGEVLVDGARAEADLEASLLTVTLPAEHAAVVTVVVPFAYAVPERDEPGLGDLLGGALTPADIGLLGRSDDEVSLAHWMPWWVPEGRSAQPDPDGFGDLGNFAATDVVVRLDVPEGWAVVDSGVHTDEQTAAGRTVVTSEGAGMRDFAVTVLRDHETETRELDGTLAGVTISATSPGAQSDELAGVLDETETALRVLSGAFGRYPWREFDVVAVPLGGAVGGMEWPGATWIQSDLMAGGVPGLGGLGITGEAAGELLEGLGGEEGQDLSLLLTSTRRWTLAHEVAHSWWTVLVGNDSLADPVVDEPLAQYSSCLVVRRTLPDGDDVCRVQIASGYETMRATGGEDAAADQASDAFTDASQYGGLVYGKAASFYLDLEARHGTEAVTAALAGLVERGAFRTVTPEEVRDALVAALGRTVRPAWTRWMTRAHGDADLR